MFKRRTFFDEARIVAALRTAEAGTSGELRVSVDPKADLPAQEAAARAFRRLGMHRTAHRNGVLILVQPNVKRFAVLGDRGLHAKVGQAFWDGIAEGLKAHFAEGRFTEGLEAALAQVGEELARHFPAEPGNPDELPDAVDRG